MFWRVPRSHLVQHSAGAAHENGLEQFPAFSLAVLAAYVSGVDREFAGKVAFVHCVARLLYNIVYIKFVRCVCVWGLWCGMPCVLVLGWLMLWCVGVGKFGEVWGVVWFVS